MVNAALAAKLNTQTLLFQMKTFIPSNIPKGMRSIAAIQALNQAMTPKLKA